jgi:hypothetical protein
MSPSRKYHALLFSLPLLLASTSSVAGKFDARENLRKWGFSYCMRQYSISEEAKLDAGRAMGGYFENGQHNSEIAYESIRKYIDSTMKTHSFIGKDSSVRLVLMQCIAIYESTNFKSKIAENDKYID